MASSRKIVSYKQTLAALFINNERIVELINQADITNPEKLIHNNIFEFIRIPEVPEEQKTFICIEISIPEVYTVNFLFKQLVIEIYVISHQGLMVTDEGGCRTDLLAAEVDEMLSGYKGIGVKPLELISNVPKAVGDKHRARVLRFKTEISAKDCGIDV